MTDLKKPEPPHILVVDDSKVVRWSANKLLQQEYTVHLAADGAAAWTMLQELPEIDLVLCDLQMPVLDGYGLLKRVRAADDSRLINLPVIIITGEEDEDQTREQVRNAGATDFILKPFNEVILRSRVAAFIGHQRHALLLEEQTEIDPISGLAGRRFFQAIMESHISLAVRHQTEFSVAVLEIDKFQGLLQMLGDKVFLQLLYRVGSHIKITIRKGDLAARIDRAQFGLVLPLTNRIGGRRGIERICAVVEGMVLRYAKKPLKVRIKGGVTWFDKDHPVDFNELVGQALSALDQAKATDSQVAEFNRQDPVVVEETPAQETLDPGIEQILEQLRSGQGDDVDNESLRKALIQLWPLFEHANGRLGLEMGPALRRAHEQL